MKLHPFSIGVGDRFGHEAEAQVRALLALEARGPVVVPVWNKSNREHTLIGSEPAAVRTRAAAAVAACGWRHPYHCDADHIGLKTVGRFIEACDFFTLDVAEQIGTPPAQEADARAAADYLAATCGSLALPGQPGPSAPQIRRVVQQYLVAAQEAGRIFRHLEAVRGRDNFITEVSMDETAEPQGPQELLLILALLAREGVRVQTIAPKFSGHFHKGVDYIGDLRAFDREFGDDLDTLALAVRHFDLPAELKLSVHSGSDKFSLYPIIARHLRRTGAGLHLKTAGTTWLEEVIGLAEAGGQGLALARELYREALRRRAELEQPYATVVAIRAEGLPSLATVDAWSADAFAAALRHDPQDPRFNRELRQLLHIAFKLAAEMGPRFTDALVRERPRIEANVQANLLQRHLLPLFG